MATWLLLLTLTYGPYHAQVVRVVDSLTVVLEVTVWPGMQHRVMLRLDGINAPALKADCEAERLMAEEAREFTRVLLGRQVTIHAVRPTRRNDRVFGQLQNSRGQDLGQALRGSGYAVAGNAGSWCPPP